MDFITSKKSFSSFVSILSLVLHVPLPFISAFPDVRVVYMIIISCPFLVKKMMNL